MSSNIYINHHLPIQFNPPTSIQLHDGQHFPSAFTGLLHLSASTTGHFSVTQFTCRCLHSHLVHSVSFHTSLFNRRIPFESSQCPCLFLPIPLHVSSIFFSFLRICFKLFWNPSITASSPSIRSSFISTQSSSSIKLSTVLLPISLALRLAR